MAIYIAFDASRTISLFKFAAHILRSKFLRNKDFGTVTIAYTTCFCPGNDGKVMINSNIKPVSNHHIKSIIIKSGLIDYLQL